MERLEPVQFGGHSPPKPLEIRGRLAAEVLVLRYGADAGVGRKVARRRKEPLLFHDVVDLTGDLC